MKPEDIDWKEVAMAILHGVGEAEGCVFTRYWPLPDDIKEIVNREYDEWYKRRKEAGQ